MELNIGKKKKFKERAKIFQKLFKRYKPTQNHMCTLFFCLFPEIQKCTTRVKQNYINSLLPSSQKAALTFFLWGLEFTRSERRSLRAGMWKDERVSYRLWLKPGFICLCMMPHVRTSTTSYVWQQPRPTAWYNHHHRTTQPTWLSSEHQNSPGNLSALMFRLLVYVKTALKAQKQKFQPNINNTPQHLLISWHSLIGAQGNRTFQKQQYY